MIIDSTVITRSKDYRQKAILSDDPDHDNSCDTSYSQVTSTSNLGQCVKMSLVLSFGRS